MWTWWPSLLQKFDTLLIAVGVQLDKYNSWITAGESEVVVPFDSVKFLEARSKEVSPVVRWNDSGTIFRDNKLCDIAFRGVVDD